MRAGLTEDDHLLGAVQWLERAQDATGDGGVSGRYSLTTGWTSSYPETTGYIVPTFLDLAEEGHERFRRRASDAVAFLLGLQLDGGAFPGGEVHENRREPSIFNTAQILTGLVAWHRATGSGEALAAARRAGDWLCAMQDEDGAWRRHCYLGRPTTYTAHASCWLAELGEHVGDDGYRRSAERHLDWVLASRDPSTGWFDFAGFFHTDHDARRAVTHTIAYTLWGTLLSGGWLGRPDAVSAVAQAADGIRRRLELSGWLPGVLDHRWRLASTYACLTGNAQMALVWMRLYDLDGDPRWVNTAWKALDLIQRAQDLDNRNPGIRGGIQGSDPIWGDYVPMTLPNWAAKFYIDAVRAKRRILSHRIPPSPRRWRPPEGIPAEPGVPAVPTSAAPLRVVLLTSPYGLEKVHRILNAWRSWGFTPAGVVIERRPVPGLWARLRGVVRADGISGIWKRLTRHGAKHDVADSNDSALMDGAVPWLEVDSLESDAGLGSVRGLRPDLLVHAGAGILRRPLLEIPRLGTLNAHMGLLPWYRGMNVAEWAVLEGSAVGCTVHHIDPGIDTGGILATRLIPAEAPTTVGALRNAVDEAQIGLLGDVVRYVSEAGALPPACAQRPEEGRQYFRMHPDLLGVVEDRLRARSEPTR